MSKEGLRSVLVPLYTWFGNAPDMMRKGKKIDIGAFAESLVYYDKVFVNIENKAQLYALLDWFKQSDSPDAIVTLMNQGELFFYYYDFVSAPVHLVEADAYKFVNIQSEKHSRLDLFKRYVVGGDIDTYYSTKGKRKAFFRALEDGVITVEARTFGKAINNAKQFVLEPGNYKCILENLLSSLKQAGFPVPVPEITVCKERVGPSEVRLHTNIDFDSISQQIGKKYQFGKHTPLAIASTTNRLLWSSAILGSDIYISSPTYDLLCDKVDEVISHFRDTKRNLKRLSVQVDFPNIREEVNRDLITANDVLRIRGISSDFRSWLHTQVDLDRDIIASYYNDIIERSGLRPCTRKLLRIALLTTVTTSGAVAGSVIGGDIGATIGTGISSSAAGAFLSDLFERLKTGWSPKIFGDSVREIVRE